MRMRLRALAVAAIVLIASAFSTLSTIRYAIFGERATAMVTQVAEYRSGRSTRMKATIDAPGIAPHGAYLLFSANEPPTVGSTIAIEHIPGKPDSYRAVDGTRLLFVLPFVASLSFACFQIYKFWREFKDHQRRSEAADRDFPQYSR
jgi:hypothetical protein